MAGINKKKYFKVRTNAWGRTDVFNDHITDFIAYKHRNNLKEGTSDCEPWNCTTWLPRWNLSFGIINPYLSNPLSYPPPSLSLPLSIFSRPPSTAMVQQLREEIIMFLPLSLCLSFPLSSGILIRLVMNLAFFSATMIHSNHTHTNTTWSYMHKRNIDSCSGCLASRGDCLVHCRWWESVWPQHISG